MTKNGFYRVDDLKVCWLRTASCLLICFLISYSFANEQVTEATSFVQIFRSQVCTRFNYEKLIDWRAPKISHRYSTFQYQFLFSNLFCCLSDNKDLCTQMRCTFFPACRSNPCLFAYRRLRFPCLVSSLIRLNIWTGWLEARLAVS